MNLSPRSWQVLLLCALWGLPAARAQAAVTCTASMTNVDFGSVDLVSGSGLTTTATLNYTCTNSNSARAFARVCFSVGDGIEGAGNFNPRVMKDGAGNSLQFQIYQPPGFSTVLGSEYNTITPTPYVLSLDLAKGAASSGSVSMQGRLVGSLTAVPPGSYQGRFTVNHTAVTINESAAAAPTNCTGNSAAIFPFTVKATVIGSCVVSANPLDFGSVDGLPGAPNVDKPTTVTATCSKPTPYTVALTPSNNNTAGAGAMLPTMAGNTDTVAYRLYSDSSRTAPWGGQVGTNTLQRTGDGTAQVLTVYGRVLGAAVNVTPDAYGDTVTVTVRY
ncbi:spore coat U domain-containing protein [Variovorax sp. J22P271]|uniref:Csu type fimbrial protein n=1 Tax=Variovorax davisae TaxID=3053515 RepID=UPI0025775057|nr:spore coat U domain-containing protein [Variovorax sp. J22P271]MDM0033207.1 spore coat U domain-containing protein [Variovorax sp. J22P271]